MEKRAFSPSEDEEDKAFHSVMQLRSDGLEVPWECAWRLLCVTCPGASLLFLTLNLRQRVGSGRDGVSVGSTGIAELVTGLPFCLLACSRTAWLIAGCFPGCLGEPCWLLPSFLSAIVFPGSWFCKNLVYKLTLYNRNVKSMDASEAPFSENCCMVI